MSAATAPIDWPAFYARHAETANRIWHAGPRLAARELGVDADRWGIDFSPVISGNAIVAGPSPGDHEAFAALIAEALCGVSDWREFVAENAAGFGYLLEMAKRAQAKAWEEENSRIQRELYTAGLRQAVDQATRMLGKAVARRHGEKGPAATRRRKAEIMANFEAAFGPRESWPDATLISVFKLARDGLREEGAPR